MPLPDGLRSFVFLAADYGNIGDIAINKAQRNFLSRYLPDHIAVQVPISCTREVIQSIRQQARSGDLITIVGGGNMGSLYPDIEELRQLVIRSFPRNRIVCFPQTLDWDDTALSAQVLRRIVGVYSRHPDIHIFARESSTRDKLIELFHDHRNVSVGYAPDTVLSATGSVLGASPGNDMPFGILRCLRDDRERALDLVRYVQLDEALARTGEPVEVTDTHVGGARLDDARCAKLLAYKIDQFRAARLVVTDRLHGMILSLLAGTPCLVLPNANHKIRQTWLDWLRNHPRVIFLDPEYFHTLPEVLDRLLEAPRGDLDAAPIDVHLYAGLQEALTAPLKKSCPRQ
jgi:exopolysaccharide biosynthesis predicted pyruvyltransferase EpsI